MYNTVDLKQEYVTHTGLERREVTTLALNVANQQHLDIEFGEN